MALASHNLRAFAVTILGCSTYVGATALVGKKKLLPERLSRKLMHIGCGPLFALCWPLYPAGSTLAPWLAASVPFLAALKFAAVGAAGAPDPLGLARGITRSGRREELMRGPFIYGLVHAGLAALAWRTPGAALAVAALCGGDGLAEVVGASVASPPLPWNPDKSTAGSAACFLGAAALGGVLLTRPGLVAGGVPAAGFWPRLLACAAVGSLVESLPIPTGWDGGDNLTVPLAVLVAASVLY